MKSEKGSSSVPFPAWDGTEAMTWVGIPIPAAERDRIIYDLRSRGWTYKCIGKAVGMSANGVSASLARMAMGRPGRPPR